MFVFIHSFTPILAEKSSSKLYFYEKRIRWLISERVLKSGISSQTWDCDVLGCKKPCGKSLTSRAWCSRSKREPEPAKFRGKCLKTSILSSLISVWPVCLSFHLSVSQSVLSWFFTGSGFSSNIFKYHLHFYNILKYCNAKK